MAEEFKGTVIRLGRFHIILNYMAALGNMSLIGLRQVLVHRDSFSETTDHKHQVAKTIMVV